MNLETLKNYLNMRNGIIVYMHFFQDEFIKKFHSFGASVLFKFILFAFSVKNYTVKWHVNATLDLVNIKVIVLFLYF